MKRNHIFTKPLAMALLITAGSVPAIASASGSYSPSSGNSQYQKYGIGKQVFHKKIVCDTCPLAGERLDKDSARELIKKLKTNDDFAGKLRAREREATIYYLKKRHKLS